MKIVLDPNIALFLETACVQAGRNEISGYGFVNIDREKQIFRVYDIVLLDIGSPVFTQIPPYKTLPLLDRPDASHLKLWWHRHPVGNGVPGKHNWSGTDDNTCRNEPLASSPELVGWSIAIVRTPRGWVGRYDTYGENGTTVHMEVEPNMSRTVDLVLEGIEIEKKAHKPTRRFKVEDESDWDNDWDGRDGIEEEDEEEEDILGGMVSGMLPHW